MVHKAIELSISSRTEAVALDLVDHAMASLADDTRRSSPRPWLLTATPLELADLRGRAHDTVVKFQECWPRLQAAWAPRTETGIGAELCGSRIVLWGRVDLVLGVARGDEARALIVDLKTGRSYPNHLDDLRFYALVQTLRIGVPPFRVASYYLDTATFHPRTSPSRCWPSPSAAPSTGRSRWPASSRRTCPPPSPPAPPAPGAPSGTTCEGPARYQASRADPDDDLPL